MSLEMSGRPLRDTSRNPSKRRHRPVSMAHWEKSRGAFMKQNGRDLTTGSGGVKEKNASWQWLWFLLGWAASCRPRNKEHRLDAHLGCRTMHSLQTCCVWDAGGRLVGSCQFRVWDSWWVSWDLASREALQLRRSPCPPPPCEPRAEAACARFRALFPKGRRSCADLGKRKFSTLPI